MSVEVITTTARAEAVDENFYHAGLDLTEPFPVHRFRVVAPDRVAYGEAVLAAGRDAASVELSGSALVDERLRSPDLLAHVRAAADRYDAFLFLDATAPTTVGAIADVSETALLVPLLDDVAATRLPAVADAVASARLLLCGSQAEADLLAERFGPAVRARAWIVGLGTDIEPADEAARERVRRASGRLPFVLLAGDEPESARSEPAEPLPAGLRTFVLGRGGAARPRGAGSPRRARWRLRRRARCSCPRWWKRGRPLRRCWPRPARAGRPSWCAPAAAAWWSRPAPGRPPSRRSRTSRPRRRWGAPAGPGSRRRPAGRASRRAPPRRSTRWPPSTTAARAARC